MARTTHQTVVRWLRGYRAPGHEMKPVFGDRSMEGSRLSFLELAEIVVVARFRADSPSLTLDRLRKARAFATKQLRLDYPFASGLLYAEGGHILHEFEAKDPGPGRLALDLDGNYVLPGVVLGALERFEFHSKDLLATRWFPQGRSVPIVVDPTLGGGAPTILGSNVRVEVLRSRFLSGESIQEISDDFELDIPAVEAALRAA